MISSHPVSSRAGAPASSVALAIAIAAGLNCLNLEVIEGARVFLGVFVILPFVLACTPLWAVSAAVLAMAPSIVTAGDGFAVLIAGVEAAWLVLGARYLRWNAILGDILFWLAAGLPLTQWLYTGVAGMPPDLTTVLFMTRAVTGVAATAVGYFVLRHTTLGGKLRGSQSDAVTVREVIFNYVFVLSLVPLACVALGFTLLSRRSAESDGRDRAFFATRDAARQTDLFFELQQSALTGLARVFERSPADAALLLEETRKAHPHFVTMLVTDAAGRIVQTSPRDQLERLRGTAVDDREYFRVARDTRRPFVSGVFQGRGFGSDILVAMSVPLFAGDGRFQGIVQASVKVAQLAAITATAAEPLPIDLVLADSAGRVIFADEPTGLQPLQLLRNTTLAAALEPGATVRPFTSDRTEPDGTLRRVNNQVARCRTAGMVVIAQWPVLDALAGMRAAYLMMAAILGGIIGSAVLVSRAAHRRLSTPLEDFSAHASRQNAAEEVAVIATDRERSPREVANVFEKFNALAFRLNASHAALRRHNAELDRRVAERTREAETARLEAEAASRSKTEFLAMTSHEIRTPLNAIIGLADVVAANPADPRAAGQVRTIRDAGTQLLGVVNDLLDLSRAEAGRLELHPAPLELGAMCHEVHALLGLRAAQQGLQLDFVIAPALPLWLETDGPRLQQVLINLIGNALKFTRAGSITVRIDLPRQTDSEVALRFAVIDTGPGLSAQEQARLFQPYVQVGDAAAGSREGTGLGLSICRRIVDLFGGTLSVRSEVGRGSEFAFAITVRRGAAPSPAHAGPAAGSTGSLHVLAVDDNEANREVLRGLLEMSFARLEVVASGAEALARLRGERFDAALVDLEMADLDGIEVARTVRAWQGAEASRGCRLIAFSAHGRGPMWERCAAAGFDDFAEKPINRRQLLHALATPTAGNPPTATPESGRRT